MFDVFGVICSFLIFSCFRLFGLNKKMMNRDENNRRSREQKSLFLKSQFRQKNIPTAFACSESSCFVLSLQKPESPVSPVRISEKKKEEKAPVAPTLSNAEKTALAQHILDQLVDDVITSDTTQPSVPGVVLDTINDIIMGEVALAKVEVAKEREEKMKEEERQRKEDEKRRKEEEKKRKEEEKKRKKQPASPPPPVVIPKSPTGPDPISSPKSPSQPSSTARQESETQEAQLDLRLDDELENRGRQAEPPSTLPSVPPTQRLSSQSEPNITINGQSLPQDSLPVVLNGHVTSGAQQQQRQTSRDSAASSHSRRSGSHTPTSPTTPKTPTSPADDQRPQYHRSASQNSKQSASSSGKVRTESLPNFTCLYSFVFPPSFLSSFGVCPKLLGEKNCVALFVVLFPGGWSCVSKQRKQSEVQDRRGQASHTEQTSK